MRTFSITEPIFHRGAKFFWDCTMAEFFALHGLEDRVKENEYSRGITLTRSGFIPSIWLEDINEQGVVVHEVLHATRSILEDVGLVYGDDAEEIFAYYQEFLYNSYLEGVMGIPSKIGVKFSQDDQEYKLSFTKDNVAKATKLSKKLGQQKKKKTKSSEKFSASK